MEGGGDDEFVVAHRWTRAETVVLANALRTREEEAHDVAAKSAVGTANDKWEAVSKFCRSHGVPRTSAQCNSRWSKGLYLDYRKVRDWQRKDGVESYWKMKDKKRRENKLPGCLDEEVYNILVSFLDPDLKQTGTPESEVDSDRPSQLVSPAVPAVEKDITEVLQAGPANASAVHPHLDSDGVGSMSDFARLQARATSGEPLPGIKTQNGGLSGDEKGATPPVRKRKRVNTAAANESAAAATVDGRPVHVVDTSREPSKDPINPVHFAAPPVIDITRSSERPANMAERSRDSQLSFPALEARLAAQNEAVWSRVRMLNEQVAQVVDMSNQRLQGHLQALFTQIRMQLQVMSAQMQAQVHEATRAVQSELQTLLQSHSDQVYSQLQSHYSLIGSYLPGQPLPKDRPPYDGNWAAQRVHRPTPPVIPPIDFASLPVPPLHLPEKDRNVRQKKKENGVDGPATQRQNIKLLPHISDAQKAEGPSAGKTRLLPHINDVDRILRQQQAMPAPLPSWNQASFVISELDRVLGHNRSIDTSIIPPPAPAKCTYVVNESDKSLRQREPSVSLSEKASRASVSPAADMFPGAPGRHSDKEVDLNSRYGRQEGSIHVPVLALPRVVKSSMPTLTAQTSSGQDAANSPTSSDTADAEETQDSAQDMGASSGQATSSPAEGETQARPGDKLRRV